MCAIQYSIGIITILFSILLTSHACAASIGTDADSMPEGRFIPIHDMVIQGAAMQTESEYLAVRSFNREIVRFTGRALPVVSGISSRSTTVLYVGNLDSLEPILETAQLLPDEMPTEDRAAQSCLVGWNASPGRTSVFAAGLGRGTKARSYLGLSYALGELIRRLDYVQDEWGFILPAKPIVLQPAMPNRTLYLMNSYNASPHLSIEFCDPDEVERYVDRLLMAQYSRVSFYQWHPIYLYPGNNEERRAENERIHQTMRHFFSYARKRGLEIYHQLTPAHINPNLLENPEAAAGQGYYGKSGICWNHPEAVELARKMAQVEISYYGPMDGYIVWFYDPAGCFCDVCQPNQAEMLFSQLEMVVDLAESISPDADFQVCLWPTWCFHEYQEQGIPYSKDEAEAFVRDFLERCLARFGPRGMAIMDTCEADNSNIYNGLVKPDEFLRTAFMYSVMGMASEHGYPFAPFRIRYLAEKMGLARDRGLEDGNFFIQYALTNFPSVFAFADASNRPDADPSEIILRYAAHEAKGEALSHYAALLEALEDSSESTAYTDRDDAIQRAEALIDGLRDHPLFFGDWDWLAGQVYAQRYYLEMARAKDAEDFAAQYAAFINKVGAIPMYAVYMEESLSPALVVDLHLQTYWRGPAGDTSTIGKSNE